MKRKFRNGISICLGLVLFFAFYPVKLASYICKKIFVSAPEVSLCFDDVYADTFYSVEEALKIILSKAQNVKEETKTLSPEQKKSIAAAADIDFDPELDKEYKFYTGESDGQIIGYAVESVVKGKWGPIHYMLALDREGKVSDVIVLELRERRGRPVKERKFLNQFLGKTKADPIKLKKDIKGVSGATISSTGMSNGIRKLVYVFNELYKK